MKRFLSSILISGIALTLLIVTSCKTAREETLAEQQTPVDTPAPPFEEQEQLAMDTFNKMLDMSIERPREEVIPELEAGYKKIITEAPDTYLAEESHYRLVVYYFEDFSPPQVEKAEGIYRQYFERYPDPKLGKALNGTLARLYYNFQLWDHLSDFMIPFIKQYVETGKIEDSLYLFYYSEAKFHLEDYGEAARGFRLMIRENPPDMELKHARKRLVEIRHLLDPNITKEQ